MTFAVRPLMAWSGLPHAAKTLLKDTLRTLEERYDAPLKVGGMAEREAIMRDAAIRLIAALNDAATNAKDIAKRLSVELAKATEERDAELLTLYRSIVTASPDALH